MKVIIYAFSGTGNTLKVASLYKKYLKAEVTVFRVTEKNKNFPSPEGYDLIGIGYPVHGFAAPEPIVNFTRKLPKVAYRRAFIFKTSGEGLHVNDASSFKLLKILKNKGYEVAFERHYVMPYNMIYRHSDAMAKQMWIYAHALCELNCREILNYKREKIEMPFYALCAAAVIGGLEQWFAHVHGPFFKVDKDKCLDCGRCAAVCPQNNISYDGNKFKFGKDCVLCMGCSFGCPGDAISVGVFKFWKVNGSYRLNDLVQDDSVSFPLVPDGAKGIYRLYKKYYREVDEELKGAGIDVNAYV